MSLYIVDIHGELEGDYEIIRKYEEPTTKNDLGVEEVTALAEWTEKLTKASEDAYNKGYADGMKAQEPRKGHWVDADGDNAICSCCNRLNHLYGAYCKHCGAKMEDV